MLDERDPLSQIGPQWDGDQQRGQSTSRGTQPRIPSAPWKTGPTGKVAALPQAQMQKHTVPQNMRDDSEPHGEDMPHQNRPGGPMKTPGYSGVNSVTEDLFKI